MKLKATLMRWSPGTTPRIVGVVELVVTGLEPELPPPPHAEMTRLKAMQKVRFFGDVLVMLATTECDELILMI
jgi:hypothetical protein